MKVLVANRGEIAVRIMRACRELGLSSVAVYSACDRQAPHVRYADEAFPIGPNEPAESYLRIDKLLDVARRAGADAVHPGYGFLAEQAAFARACRDAGVIFVGPSAEVIELMGGKTAARAAARAAGIPVVPGNDRALDESISGADLISIAEQVGYPLLVKAVAGGGGKGMRLVRRADELRSAVRSARSEAATTFGDTSIYFERLLERPRHVEIQVLGDEHGRVVACVERECSVQRRHQKVLEEAPSVAVDRPLRASLAEAATALARSVGYTNAGTIEFLLDADGRFYFLEMNTRLQVEHPVTEMITGIDLVHWQFRIARGERIDLDTERLLAPRGHAIECRIYAEDPDAGFIPSPGRIHGLRTPSGPGIRDDSGVAPGFEVPVFYDSLISKLVAWGDARPQAVSRLRRALSEYDVRGIKTTIPFFRWLLDQPVFREGRLDTTFVDRVLQSRRGEPFTTISVDDEDVAIVAAAVHAYQSSAGRGPSLGSGPEPSAGWKRAARLEALRN